MLDETLFFYMITLSAGFINMEEYNQWLNENFLNSEILSFSETENDLLLELEFCSSDKNKTIDMLHSYLYSKINKLNYKILGKKLLDKLKEKYNENPENLEEWTHKLYDVWRILPREMSEQEPFYTMSYIDDIYSYAERNECLKKIHWLLNYYNN